MYVCSVNFYQMNFEGFRATELTVRFVLLSGCLKFGNLKIPFSFKFIQNSERFRLALNVLLITGEFFLVNKLKFSAVVFEY